MNKDEVDNFLLVVDDYDFYYSFAVAYRNKRFNNTYDAFDENKSITIKAHTFQNENFLKVPSNTNFEIHIFPKYDVEETEYAVSIGVLDVKKDIKVVCIQLPIDSIKYVMETLSLNKYKAVCLTVTKPRYNKSLVNNFSITTDYDLDDYALD